MGQTISDSKKIFPKTLFFPLIFSIFSGVLLALSFPKWEFSLFAFIGLVPLFFAIRHQSLRQSFVMGWIAGLFYFGSTLSWVTITMGQYGHLSPILSNLLMFLLIAYLSLYTGLFATLVQWGNTITHPVIARGLPPIVWVSLEWLRGHLLTGFPWSSLGYSQYHFLSLIQIADFSGVYGVGFVLVATNILLFRMLIARHGIDRLKEGAILVGLWLFLFGYGAMRLSQNREGSEILKVTVVQGNVAQDQKWDRSLQEKTVTQYARLSFEAVQHQQQESSRGNSPSLVIWPEAAMPFVFHDEPRYQSNIRVLSQEGRFYLLFGSLALIKTDQNKMAFTNSAYLLSPTAGEIFRYDKIHLVPFGEYVPFGSLLSFVNKMVEGIGDFVPGENASVMEVGQIKVGTAICFEVIFPELVRQFVKNGASIMTTLTNDAWFGDSAAPYQHFSMVVFRAVENRTPFARAANTGISGFINAQGKILQTTPLFVEATLSASLHPGIQKTFYTLFGDLFAYACVTITLLFTTYLCITPRKIKQERSE